jgi:hypothetical protein
VLPSTLTAFGSAPFPGTSWYFSVYPLFNTFRYNQPDHPYRDKPVLSAPNVQALLSRETTMTTHIKTPPAFSRTLALPIFEVSNWSYQIVLQPSHAADLELQSLPGTVAVPLFFCQ